MPLSSLTPSESGFLYRDQTTILRATLSAVGATSWPEAPVLHIGAVEITATLEDDVAIWSVTEAQTEALTSNMVAFWVSLGSGVGAVQILGGALERVEHGRADGNIGLTAQVVVGPTGPSAYQAAVDAGYTGTEAEWSESMAGLPEAETNAAASAQAASDSATSAAGSAGAAIAAKNAAQQAVTDAQAALTSKQDKSALEADVASKLGTGGALDVALSSTYVTRVIRKLYAPASSIIPQPQRAFPELHDSAPIWTPSASHLITGGVEVPILQAAAWHSTMRLVTETAGSLTVQAANGGEGGLAWGAVLLTWEWISDAPNLAIRGNFGANPLSLMVDGKLASLVPYATPGTEFVRIRWNGERKLRHYRLTGSSARIQGIVVGPTDSIWPYPTTTRPMVGWCGDSYSQGEPDATLHWRGIPHIAAAVMGVNLALSAEGGSGYAIGTSGGTNTFVSRLAAFAARQDLSAMVWAGGRNDPTTAGTLQAAAEACFAGFAVDHPGVPQIALGPWSPSTTWQTTYANQYTQIAAAAAAHGVTFIDTRDWIKGDGYVGATTGSGNADILMDSTAHPTAPAGREYLGVRVGLAIADALQKGL